MPENHKESFFNILKRFLYYYLTTFKTKKYRGEDWNSNFRKSKVVSIESIGGLVVEL